MKNFQRIHQRIGTRETYTETLDRNGEATQCLSGTVVESGISTVRLASGEEMSQTIEFLQTQNYGTVLFLDGMLQTCDRPEMEAPYHETIAHVPMMIHPSPRQVLVLGGGDGAVVREVLKHPSVTQCVMVELDRNVVSLSRKHIPCCTRALSESEARLQIVYQDCFQYLDCGGDGRKFDVVIIDLTDLIDKDQAVTRYDLYSGPFYRKVHDALHPDGIVMTHVGRLIDADRDINRRVHRQIADVFDRVELLHVYVPMFWMEWLFCVASRSKNAAAFTTVADREKRLADISDQTQVYDGDFHHRVFAPHPLVRRIMEELAPA